ncbi:hypothetical protein GQ602_004597 [Ophiocordyceps camponoti-floridani]|uniref:DUF7029 domain-containing protein n=1 Tax=Ophiocordyceps camponoti-floridani TaxID=2030778 RepID=A0A8H4VDZ3_9HYPO|nr:hypothetical protein GQ602_004597 [Ophiocordyceps camponoti-floridani]
MAPLSTVYALIGLVVAAGALPGNSSGHFHFQNGGRVRGSSSSTPSPVRPAAPGTNSFRPEAIGSVPGNSSRPVRIASPATSSSDPKTNGSLSSKTGRLHPGSPPPATTLLPGTHWAVDTKPAEKVKPVPAGSASSPLFYGDASASKAGHFALLTYTFTKPSVNLDEADHADVSILDQGHLAVDFQSRDAFEHARGSWSIAKAKAGLVLIVYADGCGGHGHGERCFFDVDDLQFSGKRRIVVRGRAVHPHDISSGGETEWGWWTPEEKSLERRGVWSSIWGTVKRLFPEWNGPSAAFDLDKSISWMLPNHTQSVTPSPWAGDAILLKSTGSTDVNGTDPFMHIFCVDCGSSGRARLAGRAAWSLRQGLTEGHIELRTDMALSLKVGVDVRGNLRTEIDRDLMGTDLPGLNFGPVAVEPHVSIRARAVVDAASQGRLLAGVEMGLRNAHAVVDLVDSSKNDVGGWKPYFQPILQADGRISLEAEMGLPVAFECSLRVGPWHKMVAIVDEPSIGANVQSMAAVGYSAASRFPSVGFRRRDSCKGINTQLSLRNYLSYRTSAGERNGHSLFDTGRRKLPAQCIHA